MNERHCRCPGCGECDAAKGRNKITDDMVRRAVFRFWGKDILNNKLYTTTDKEAMMQNMRAALEDALR